MTFADLKKKNRERCEEVFHPIDSWTPTDWACALAGEVGEACNLIKKMRRGDPKITRIDVGEELADVVIYADLLAQRLGLDLGYEVQMKFNLVSERRGSSVILQDTPVRDEPR